jgi:hypothetical protein
MPLPEHPHAKQNKANRRSEETDNVFLLTDSHDVRHKQGLLACVRDTSPGISNPQREKKKVGGRNAPDCS